MEIMLHKLMPVVVKKLGDRMLEIAGSTEDKDRQGDIIRASGWKLVQFKKNPIFLWAHQYSSLPIGRATKVWIDKATKHLMFNIEFAPPETYEFADTIFKLYEGGYLHATSVGFIPLDWEGKSEEHPFPKWEDNVFTSQELLELSAVPVPANPNALVSARDTGVITVKEFEAIGSMVSLQEHNLDAAILSLDKQVTEPEETEEIVPASDADATITDNDTPPPEAREISQEQLRDDIDYLHKAIVEHGMNEDTAVLAAAMAWEILERIPGADIPDEIEPAVEPLPELDPQEVAAQRAKEVAGIAAEVMAKLRGKIHR